MEVKTATILTPNYSSAEPLLSHVMMFFCQLSKIAVQSGDLSGMMASPVHPVITIATALPNLAGLGM